MTETEIVVMDCECVVSWAQTKPLARKLKLRNRL
jgi:hypothetical protein